MDDSSGDGESVRGALAVVALGGALAVGFTANLVRELSSLDVAWPPVAVWAFGVTLAGSLAYAGWRLADEEFAEREMRTVAAWSYLGAGAFALVVMVTLVVRIAEGRSLAEPELELLIAADAGGIAGAVAGHRTVLARREAAAASRTRDTMSFLNRTLRHELLNGVQLLSGHAALLADHVDEDGAAAITTIEETTDELADLIEDARLVADLHDGTAELRAVDVAELVAAQADWLDDAYPEATVVTDLPENATARANEAIEHALRNLLANAVEHNDGSPTVEVTVDVAPDAVTVLVADDGPGIPDDEKRAVLEPAEGDTHGFGLHLARMIVEGYDGRLTIEDNEPRGTVIVVELPRPWSPTRDAGGATSPGDVRDDEPIATSE